MTITDATTLAERHAALLASTGTLRIRERAARLGVAEAQLVAARLGVDSQPLAAPPQAIFTELGALGQVMALTRNDACVHERHGRYEDFQSGGNMGLVLGPDIDLRLFFSGWRHAFAVLESGRASLQFFDATGTAIHKIYRTERTDAAAWDALVTRFVTSDDAGSWLVVEPRVPAATTPDALAESLSSDVTASLRDQWVALKDTHDFFPMLRRLNLTRLAALGGVGPDLAQQVPADTIESMLTTAAETELPIMCFVGNPGMIQIHSGPIARLARTGPWFNVLDPMFNLHLDTTAITSCWIVSKPSVDGWITSLEVFAADGSLIVQFFGARKPGKPELTDWRSLMTAHCATRLHA